MPTTPDDRNDEPVPPGTADISPPRPRLEKLRALLEKQRQERDKGSENNESADEK